MNFNKLPQDREKARDVSVKEMPEDFDIADLSKIKNFGGSSVVYEPCEGYIVKENISVDDSICHDFQTGLENKTTNAIEANL